MLKIKIIKIKLVKIKLLKITGNLHQTKRKRYHPLKKKKQEERKRRFGTCIKSMNINVFGIPE